MKKNTLAFLALFTLALSVTAQVKKPAAKTTSPAKKPPLSATGSVIASIERGKAVYASTCLVCHQADGLGVTSLNPPLAKTDYVTGDRTRLINILLKGLNKEIEIDGDTYANPMPPLAHLSDAEIADVLTYVRNSFGNKGTAITAAQVKTARAVK